MPFYERISLVVSVTLLGLVVYFLIELPNRAVELTLLGSPLTLVISQRWLMALLLGGLAATGSSAIVHTHPLLPPRGTGYSLAFWLLPALLMILTTLALPLLVVNLEGWMAGIGITGTLMWLVMLAEYHTIDPRDRWFELSHFWLNLVGHGVAFGFFVIIYQARSRSLLSASGVALVSGLLAASLLRAGPAQTGRTWLFAGISALVMAQSTWALNYWRVPPLMAGFGLLLLFYLFIGLAQQHLLGRLSHRALIEFGGVIALGLLAFLRFAS
jgi:hypothetical protein